MNSFTSSMSGNSVCFGRCFCVLDVLLCFYLRFLQCCLCICVLDVFASTAPQYCVCGERVPKVSQGAPTTNHRTNHLDFHQSEYTVPEIWSVIGAVNFFWVCVCVCGANSKLEQHFIACPLNEWTTTTKQYVLTFHIHVSMTMSCLNIPATYVIEIKARG